MQLISFLSSEFKIELYISRIDGQLNTLVKIQTEIHISALSFGDDHKRAYTLLFP